MRMSSSEITICLRGNGRTWRAPSCDATNYCCKWRFVRRLHNEPGSGGGTIFQAEVRMDLETSQAAARYFVKLAKFRQQIGTTARNTDNGGNCPIQADFGGNPKTTTITRVTAREESARLLIYLQQRGMTLTEQNKQFDPGE